MKKQKKINIVISNLLDVKIYLNQLEKLSVINKIDFPFIPKTIPYFLLDSNFLNDTSFNELEKSISLLKQFDPIAYSDLSGIGNTFESIKTNFIIPFLKSKEQSKMGNTISDTYINEIIKSIDKHLISVSKNLDRKTSKRIKDKVSESIVINPEDIKQEIIENYYEYIIQIMPEDIDKPTLTEFKKELENPEIQEVLNEQMVIMNNVNFDDLIKLIADSPNASIEEMNKLIQNQQPVGNNG